MRGHCQNVDRMNELIDARARVEVDTGFGGERRAGIVGAGQKAPGCQARGCGRLRDDVPRIVRELVAAGEDVYGVRVVTSTLEEAYLEVVE